jgi:hypothetical protein
MVRQVPTHSVPLAEDADRPIRHFEESANAGSSLLKYLEDHINPSDVYHAVYDRHFGHLRRMILAELLESFERFLKELASVCIDFLAPYTTDDRFDEFTPKKTMIAAVVNATSVGRALCESDTWLNNATINKRFASLLGDAGGGHNWESLFPKANENPAAERSRAASLAILWQIRHDLAHNVGVITQSDAIKLRVLVGGPVDADRRLAPTDNDLRYVKRFLSESANRTNERVGNRLAILLTAFHTVDATLFNAQDIANEVSQRFMLPLTINGNVGVL